MTNENEERYGMEVNRDMNVADYEERAAEQEALVDNPVEFEMFQWNPKAEKAHPEINKDRVGGNLEDPDMFTIHMNDELHNSIVSMRAIIKTNMPYNDKDKDLIAKFFLPETLLQAPLRRIDSILALSLSKDGFWRKLSRTRVIQKGFAYDDPSKEAERGLNWNPIPFFRKKKKPSQQSY